MEWTLSLVLLIPSAAFLYWICVRRIRAWRAITRERMAALGEERLVFTPEPMRHALEQAARELGLSFRSTGFVIELAGPLAPFEITAQHSVYGDGTRITRRLLRIEAQGAEVLPANITIGASAEEAGVPVRSGDPQFDSQLDVSGPRAVCLALMNDRLRKTLRPIAEDVALRKGRLVLRREERLAAARTPASVERIVALVQKTLELAAELRIDQGSIAARLSAIAGADPVRAVRLSALRELGRSFPEVASTRIALIAALEDSDPGVRLHAACRLGGAEQETRLAGIVRAARDSELAELCEVALAEHAFLAAPYLVEAAIDTARGRDARRAVIFALGELGGPEVIGPLRDCAEDPAMAEAIEEAVARIGKRAGDSARGRLSLEPVAAGAGAVSLAGEAQGALSLPAEPDRGALSINGDSPR